MPLDERSGGEPAVAGQRLAGRQPPRGREATSAAIQAAPATLLQPSSGTGLFRPSYLRKLSQLGGRVKLSHGGDALPLFGLPNIEKFKAKGDSPGLLKALEYQGNWRVRRDAAEALGQMGDSVAVKPLVAALKDGTSSVCLAAALALGQIGDAGAVEPLIAILKSPAGNVRKGVAEALGQIGDAGALESLVAALKDPSWSVRQAAATALGQIHDPRAIEPLRAALADQDSSVCRAVGEALGKLGFRPHGS